MRKVYKSSHANRMHDHNRDNNVLVVKFISLVQFDILKQLCNTVQSISPRCTVSVITSRGVVIFLSTTCFENRFCCLSMPKSKSARQNSALKTTMATEILHALFTMSGKFQWSFSDFHVRMPTPWFIGNRVSSSSVIVEALAVAYYPVLLPSSAQPHSGCKHRLPTSLTIQQHNKHTHTIHTKLTVGGSRWFSCALLHSGFTMWDWDCKRVEDIGSNHVWIFQVLRSWQLQ